MDASINLSDPNVKHESEASHDPQKGLTPFCFLHESEVGPLLVHLVDLIPVLGHLRSERSEPGR